MKKLICTPLLVMLSIVGAYKNAESLDFVYAEVDSNCIEAALNESNCSPIFSGPQCTALTADFMAGPAYLSKSIFSPFQCSLPYKRYQ